MTPAQLIANRFELQNLLGRGGRSAGEDYRAIRGCLPANEAVKIALEVVR